MQKFAVPILFSSSILWGLSWLPLKSLHELGFEGLQINFWVYLLLTLFVLPLAYRFKEQIQQNWIPLLAIAVLGGGAQLAFNSALIYGEVVRMMMLFYLLPLWGVLGGKFFLKEQVDYWRWLGVGLALSGVFLVLGGLTALISPPTWLDFVALLSGFLFAMNNVVFRYVQSVSISLKLLFMFCGAMTLALIALFIQNTPIIAEVEFNAWLAILFYAMLWMLITNFGSQWAVTQLEAGRASIIMIMELVAAVVSTAYLMGLMLTQMEMIGGVLIITAALIEASRSSKTVEVAPK